MCPHIIFLRASAYITEQREAYKQYKRCKTCCKTERRAEEKRRQHPRRTENAEIDYQYSSTVVFKTDGSYHDGAVFCSSDNN
jgi:hypothetical protein